MPIDEEVLQTKIDELIIKENNLEKTLSDVRGIKINLESIQIKKIKVRQEDGTAKFEVRKLIDKKLNQEMTPVRRQQEYDAIITQKTKLGL
ncbi:hypothetical protein KAH94_06105 [bacterium]|nr:hypothetical protein [bacterium]